MTDRNTKRLLDKIDLLERANKTQLELIDQLHRNRQHCGHGHVFRAVIHPRVGVAGFVSEAW